MKILFISYQVADFNNIITFNAYRGCSAKISANGKIVAYVSKENIA